MDEFNLDDLAEFGSSDDPLDAVAAQLNMLAKKDPKINEIVEGIVNKDDVRLDLATQTIGSIDASDNTVSYVKKKQDLEAIVCSISAQIGLDSVAMTRILMGIYTQQTKMTELINEQNYYLVRIMNGLVKDGESTTNADRGLGGEEQDKAGSD